MVEYVAGFAFNREFTDVILIQKKRPDWQAGKLNAVGGKCEPGETPVTAMVREFEEETGVHIPTPEWELFATLDTSGGTIHFFRAEISDIFAPKTMTDEFVRAYPLSCLFQAHETLPNLRWLIPMARPEVRGDWPYRIRERSK